MGLISAVRVDCVQRKGGEELAMMIAEVGRKYGLTPDTLRYYERIGLIPSVKRSQSGIRDYNEESCRWIEFIKCMRGAGIQVEALIEYVSLFRHGDSTSGARKQILEEQRALLSARIGEMQNTLSKLDAKIEGYERLKKAEGKLIKE